MDVDEVEVAEGSEDNSTTTANPESSANMAFHNPSSAQTQAMDLRASSGAEPGEPQPLNLSTGNPSRVDNSSATAVGQSEPLDMSVAARAQSSTGSTNVAQSQFSTEGAEGGSSSDALQQQQETMREFFPHVQQSESEMVPAKTPQGTPNPSNLSVSAHYSHSGSRRHQVASRQINRKSHSSFKEEGESPQAKFSRSSATLLLHPRLRNLGKHDLAVALLEQDKLEVSLNLKQECIENLRADSGTRPLSRTLWCLLELLLNVNCPITESHTVEWLRHLVAGGDEPQRFVEAVTRYDTRTSCGIVWTANVLAHRCNTCCYSPCMSLCSSCFNDGDHRGHDYNLFRSQSGGACDCGNASVLRPTGFCTRHHPDYKPKSGAPPHLFLMLEQIVPHIVARLIYHLREASPDTIASGSVAVSGADDLFVYCQTLCEKNLRVEEIFREVLCSTEAYDNFREGLLPDGERSNSSSSHIKQSWQWYEEAVAALPDTAMPPDYHDPSGSVGVTGHSTFLGELVFWMINYEFPEKLSCFLLSMRPDAVFEDAFTRSFVTHYGKMSQMLNRCADFRITSPRAVHVSVQLFSDQKLAIKMVKEYPLLDVLVICLQRVVEQAQIDVTPHGMDSSVGALRVVDIRHRIMTRQCFWPFVSDLNNLLGHRPIAHMLITNDWLRNQFFSFIASCQYMNPLDRRVQSYDGEHGGEEPPYVAGVSCELEVLSVGVWNLLSHLHDPNDEQCVAYMMTLVDSARKALLDWLDKIGFSGVDNMPDLTSFHLPVHRLLALYLSHATRVLKIPIARLLPSFEVLSLALTHPLKTQLLYHETMAGLHKSPVFDVQSQVNTYSLMTMGHVHFCADLFLLQLAAAHLRPQAVVLQNMHRFDILPHLELANLPDVTSSPSGGEAGSSHFNKENLRMYIFLVHLCFIAAIRTHYDRDMTRLLKRELASLLCMGDRPHSSLLELMPEKLLKTSKEKVSIRKLIKKMSIALPATITAGGVCRNGLYRPKTRVWKKYYDPLHVLLRATPRRQYQDAEQRFHEYLLSKKVVSEASELAHLWPPFVVPRPLDDPHVADPRNFLVSRTLHAVFFVYLYKALHQPHFSPSILPFLVYLIEMTVEYHISRQRGPGGDLLAAPHDGCPGDGGLRRDLDLSSWYCTDHIFRNATTLIPGVTGDVLPQPSSDDEMDFSETSSDAAVEIECSVPTPLPLLPSGGERPSLSLNVVGSEIVAYHRDPSVPDTPLTPLTPIYPPLEGGEAPSTSPQLALLPPGGSTSEPLANAAADERAVVACAEGTYVAPNSSSSELCPSSASPAAADRPDFVFPSPMAPASLPAPPQYPPLLAGTEVGRPGTSSGAAPSDGVMVPAGGRRRRHTGSPHPPLPPSGVPAKLINESMVSLLVKLYSRLTSGAHYRPNFDSVSTSRVGDGGHFVSVLLNKMGHHDSATRAHILQVVRSCAQPRPSTSGDAAGGAAGRDDSDTPEDTDTTEDCRRRAREERARQAAARKRKVMEAFKKKQTKFCEEHKDILGSISTDVETVSASDGLPPPPESSGAEPRPPAVASEWSERLKCAHCATERDEPLGLVVFVLPNSSEAHRRLRVCEGQGFPLTERRLQALSPQNRSTLLSCAKERYQAALASNYHVSWQLWENRGFDFSTSAVTCGHFVHLDCQQNYHRNVRANPNLMLPDDVILDSRYGDYLCGMCRGYTNATIPLTPSIRHWIHTGNVPQKSRTQTNSSRPPPPLEETKGEDPVSQALSVQEGTRVQNYYIGEQQQSVAVDLSVDRSRNPASRDGGGQTSADQASSGQEKSEQDSVERRNSKPNGGNDVEPDDSKETSGHDDKERRSGEVCDKSDVSSTSEQSPEMSFDEALKKTMPAGDLEAPVMVYELLRTHDITEFSGLTKYNLQTLYERLTGLPLSRVRHILDDSYNTCKLGYLNGCLRTQLESQLSAMGGLVLNAGHEPRRGWDPSNLLTVCMFDMLSYSSQAVSHQVLAHSSIRDWVSDRWGQVCLHPLISCLPTYDSDVMLSGACAKPKERYRRSQRYSRHQEYLAPEELEELEEQAWRYQRQPVLPLLTADPVAALLQFWLMLPHSVLLDAVDCIITYCYRVALVQATLAALRDLNSKGEREQVVEDSKAADHPLAPLLETVYARLRDCDGHVFYKHQTELDNEALLAEVHDQHRDEMLMEMRLQDVEDEKKLQRAEQERLQSIRTEDMTDSDDSDSDDSDKSELEELRSRQQLQDGSHPGYVPPATSLEQVSQHITGLCLEYLRIASLLRQQLYNSRPLPIITSRDHECRDLERYLGLDHLYSVVNASTIKRMCGSSASGAASHALLKEALDAWCPALRAFAISHWEASSVLLRRQLFSPPTILKLPKIYEFLFKFYYHRPCERCCVPVANPMVCLICGAVVCDKDPQSRGKYHYVQHSNHCGGSHGLFLAINQTITVIVRGPRVMKWDSLYLDIYGETDMNIRRGRTLRLNVPRLEFLVHHYVTNTCERLAGVWRFPHTLNLQ